MSQVSCIAQASDRYKMDCFELLEVIHYSVTVANISEEKANEVEIRLRSGMCSGLESQGNFDIFSLKEM